MDVAKSHHWDVLPCQHVNEYGTPFLKDMYFAVFRKYNATFYGFSNGDILYNSGLLQTLDHVKDHLGYLNTSFITGRRWNHNMANVSDYDSDPIWVPETVTTLAREGVSNLSTTWSEDYFFVNKDYPWHGIKDVVIGRLAYDNYLVARSIQMSVPSIDGTKTIAAVHQNGPTGFGEGRRSKDSDYNTKKIGLFDYGAGKTDCTWFVTKRDILNRVVLFKRLRPSSEPDWLARYRKKSRWL